MLKAASHRLDFDRSPMKSSGLLPCSPLEVLVVEDIEDKGSGGGSTVGEFGAADGVGEQRCCEMISSWNLAVEAAQAAFTCIV